MAVTFYFTRHGETQFNVENRVQGWCDSPLTEKGVRDARLLGRGLADRDFAAAYASDASRARDTLALALEARAEARACEGRAIAPVPVREDARLREWCFGALEGEPSEAMRQCLRDLFGEDLPREAQNRRLNEIADYLNATDPTERAENFGRWQCARGVPCPAHPRAGVPVRPRWRALSLQDRECLYHRGGVG